MNAIESFSGTILGEEDVCAKFIIDDVASPYILSKIAKAGERYTFRCWIRAEVAGSITACGTTFPATTEWVKHETTFIANAEDLSIAFGTVGVYYIYHPQLEVGTIATDWRPAPEDLDSTESIDKANERTQEIYESLSGLIDETELIKGSVTNVEGTIEGVSGDLAEAKAELASIKHYANGIAIEMQRINSDGVAKVTTTTGAFDENGLTIDKSDSPTKTQVTPDGMIVYKKDAGGEQQEVLEATSEGVDATNLHAKTYLIVGGRSRFENFGTDRTGCFWIGG